MIKNSSDSKKQRDPEKSKDNARPLPIPLTVQRASDQGPFVPDLRQIPPELTKDVAKLSETLSKMVKYPIENKCSKSSEKTNVAELTNNVAELTNSDDEKPPPIPLCVQRAPRVLVLNPRQNPEEFSVLPNF